MSAVIRTPPSSRLKFPLRGRATRSSGRHFLGDPPDGGPPVDELLAALDHFKNATHADGMTSPVAPWQHDATPRQVFLCRQPYPLAQEGALVELEERYGLVLFKGFPVTHLSPKDLHLLHAGMASHVGHLRAQTVFRRTCPGPQGRWKARPPLKERRGSKHNRALPFHNDPERRHLIFCAPSPRSRAARASSRAASPSTMRSFGPCRISPRCSTRISTIPIRITSSSAPARTIVTCRRRPGIIPCRSSPPGSRGSLPANTPAFISIRRSGISRDPAPDGEADRGLGCPRKGNAENPRWQFTMQHASRATPCSSTTSSAFTRAPPSPTTT